MAVGKYERDEAPVPMERRYFIRVQFKSRYGGRSSSGTTAAYPITFSNESEAWEWWTRTQWDGGRKEFLPFKGLRAPEGYSKIRSASCESKLFPIRPRW